jgi:hypothetical protein
MVGDDHGRYSERIGHGCIHGECFDRALILPVIH